MEAAIILRGLVIFTPIWIDAKHLKKSRCRSVLISRDRANFLRVPGLFPRPPGLFTSRRSVWAGRINITPTYTLPRSIAISTARTPLIPASRQKRHTFPFFWLRVDRELVISASF